MPNYKHEIQKKQNNDIIPYISGAILIISYCLGAPYISRIISSVGIVQAAMYGFSVLLTMAAILLHGKRLNREFYIIAVLFIYLFIITVYSNVDIKSLVSYAIPVVAFSVFILYVNYYDAINVMRIWGMILGLFVFIDLITIFVFPNGMYSTVHVRNTYTINWFLGYKTARTAFSLPALLFVAIASVSKQGNIGKSFYILSAIIIVDTYMSHGATAIIGIAFFIAVVIVASRFNYGKQLPRIFKLLLDSRIFFLVLLLVWFMTVVLRDNVFLFDTMTDYLDKTSTLSGRTFIWDRCLAAVEDSHWIGIGVVDRERMEFLTGGMVNAHSQLLSILLHGGIPATVLYVFSAIAPMSTRRTTQIDYIMQFAIYTFFIIGLVSSTLTYSPIFFMTLVLIDRRREDTLMIRKLNNSLVS